jgi:hypothetical protein
MCHLRFWCPRARRAARSVQVSCVARHGPRVPAFSTAFDRRCAMRVGHRRAGTADLCRSRASGGAGYVKERRVAWPCLQYVAGAPGGSQRRRALHSRSAEGVTLRRVPPASRGVVRRAGGRGRRWVRERRRRLAPMGESYHTQGDCNKKVEARGERRGRARGRALGGRTVSAWAHRWPYGLTRRAGIERVDPTPLSRRKASRRPPISCYPATT